ncbi:MAG TPA: GNAT family protein [Vicinamibacterales bacterium]|nr:GNAT family protein [Vicinamibacterales bacterium]
MSTPVFPLVGAKCRLRPWRPADLPALVHHADNPLIAAQLRDSFPFPYTDADGLTFIRIAAAAKPPQALAIEVNGAACGSVGIVPRSGNERRTAEIGYWLGEALWGRGIGPEALSLMTRYAAAAFDLARLEAFVITSNTRSCRTLEKAGYQLEGRTRRSFLKDGVLHDQCCYAWVAE